MFLVSIIITYLQWTVVHEPVSISQDQLEAFRMLMNKEEEPLGE